ncbi:MAG: 2-amino-4-hydroxy-6-hydroxymethyldihydropteridine diphosphokinase [Croceibacterium sp.]
MLAAACAALDRKKLTLVAASPVIESVPVGPSQRRYANGAAVIATRLKPRALLKRLKRIERYFGRRPGGPRWAARVLDLDIVLWSGGAFAAPGLIIPHPLFRTRNFVLRPAVAIAGQWRDPLTRLSVRHLHARLTRPRPLRR